MLNRAMVACNLFMLNASLFAAPPTWTPANSHGLTLGRARREDAPAHAGHSEYRQPYQQR